MQSHKQTITTHAVNKELVLFAKYDVERAIPSVMDGFKPGQRKVLCIHVCVYVYTYMYVYTYIYIYICTYVDANDN